MKSARELSTMDKIRLKILKPFKNVLKEIWGMTTGKIALILIIVLTLISISAALTMPPGFLESWQSAAYWEDNPIIAPPSWVKYFGEKIAPSVIDVKTKPDIRPQWDPSTGILVLTYRFQYTLDNPVLPQDYYLAVEAKTLEGRAPQVTVGVKRPDGINVVLWDVQLAAQSNETLVSYKTNPADIVSQKFNAFVIKLLEEYNVTVPESITGENEEIIALSNSKLLDAVSKKIVQPTIVLSVFQEPVDISRWVSRNTGAVNETLGTILNGVIALRKYLEGINAPSKVLQPVAYVESNITYLVSNIDKVTFSEVYETLRNSIQLLKEAYKYSMLEDVPPEASARINDLLSYVDKQVSNMKTTVSFINVDPVFGVLTGNYVFELNVTYTNVTELPLNAESLVKQAKFVVKGTASGILGTINNGMDLATLLYYGFPIALLIGLVASVSSTLIGVIAGITSGYYGGWIDEAIQRTVDVLNNIPFLPLMIIIGSTAQKTLPPGAQKSFYIIMLYVIILIIFSWTGLAIVVRSMTLSIKEEPYVEAARAMGASNKRIIFHHIFPQVMMYAVATLVFNVPGAILTEAGLSVLGLRHGWPTWGAVLAEARTAGIAGYSAWWWIIPPGLLLSITSLTFVLLGLAVERIVEPRLRTM